MFSRRLWLLCSDRGEYDKGQPREEGLEKRQRKRGEDGMREGGSKDVEGGWGMRAMGVGCQSGGGDGG